MTRLLARLVEVAMPGVALPPSIRRLFAPAPAQPWIGHNVNTLVAGSRVFLVQVLVAPAEESWL